MNGFGSLGTIFFKNKRKSKMSIIFLNVVLYEWKYRIENQDKTAVTDTLSLYSPDIPFYSSQNINLIIQKQYH